MESVGRKIPNEFVSSLKATELCLGLPGGGGGDLSADLSLKASGKRGFSETVDLKLNIQRKDGGGGGGGGGVGVDLNENVKNISTNVDGQKSLICSKDPAKPPAK